MAPTLLIITGQCLARLLLDSPAREVVRITRRILAVERIHGYVKPRPHQQQCRSNGQQSRHALTMFLRHCCWCGPGFRLPREEPLYYTH